MLAIAGAGRVRHPFVIHPADRLPALRLWWRTRATSPEDAEIAAVQKLIAQQALSWPEIRRLMTVPGVNVILWP